MDIADSISPKSDQMDYDDLLAGPRTFTITDVRRGPSPDQPVEVGLQEFDRPWRPAKSMRRVLVIAWGPDASQYVGRRVTLFGDPTVKFGGIAVGGIRVSHLSDIPETLSIALTVSRAKRSPYTVEPLPPLEQPKDTSGRDWLVELADTDGDPDLIKGLGTAARAAHAAEPIIQVILAAYKDAKAATQ